MSFNENSGMSDFLAQVNDLYLSKDFSDVVFIFGDEKLPAHQLILGLRCPAFKKMFLKEEEDKPKSETSVSPEAPLEAFKQLLKFIYTGIVELNDVNNETVVDTLQLAETYQLAQLQQFCFDQIQSICTIDNVVEITNDIAAKLHDASSDHYFDYLGTWFSKLIQHDSFNQLSREALRRLFNFKHSTTPPKLLFPRFVEWMKANPTESEHFPELLKHVDIRSMTIDVIASVIRPWKLIDGNELLDIVSEQASKVIYPVSEQACKVNYPEGNVLSPAYNSKVISGGPSTFFTTPIEGIPLLHKIESGTDDITIDLLHLYMLNYLEMDLPACGSSYVIDVSKDNANWTRIIDHSEYTCQRVQRLYFNEREVRFISIRGTASKNDVFEVWGLEAYHTKEHFEIDPETTLLIPSHNVTEYEMIYYDSSHKDCINRTMQLHRPYLLNGMTLPLPPNYNYDIQVSSDGNNWTYVFSGEIVTSKHTIKFDKQPVVFIHVAGYSVNGAR